MRSGPNEISIRSVEAVLAIHGPGSRCTKAPFYDLLLPRVSIITTRNKILHDQRRRIWDHGFSTKGTWLKVASTALKLESMLR